MKLKKLMSAVLFIFLFFSAGSWAQIADKMPEPPIKKINDRFGIDLVSGSVSLPGMNVSIGQSESGIVRDPGSEWSESDNFTGTLTDVIVSKDVMGLPTGVALVKVNVEGNQDFFQLNGSVYENVKASGSTFSCVTSSCTYITKYGVKYAFNKSLTNKYSQQNVDSTNTHANDEKSYSYQKNSGLLTKIIRLDGEVIELSYINYPAPWAGSPKIISSVKSSLGWMLKYEYYGFTSNGLKITGQRSITAINSSVEYCDAINSCSSLTQAWQKSTMTHEYTTSPISQTSYVNTLLSSSVFDALGNETKYTKSNNTAPGGGGGITYRSPDGVGYNFDLPGCTLNGGNGVCYQETYTGKVKTASVGSLSFTYEYEWVSGKSKEARNENGTIVTWWSIGKPLSITDKLGRKTVYEYADPYGDKIDKIIDPDATPSQTVPTGGYTDYDYDDRGNVTTITVYPKTSGTPLVTSATYSPTCDSSNQKFCNKPLTITDQNGVTTTYTYSPDHGGVLTATKPAVNGIEAQTKYTYEQKTPFVKNSSGSLVASAPVWRLVKISKCMTQTLNTCAGTADEWVTEYSDFTNNLLPRSKTERNGNSSVSLTTTTEYDIYGNVSSEDGPRSGNYDAVYYFYDALRQKIGEIGPDPDGSGPLPRQAIRTAYNGDGKVTSVETGVVYGINKADLEAMTATEQTATAYSTIHGLPEVERYYAAGVLKRVTQTSYDAKLRVDCVAKRMNPSVFSSLPSSACTLGAAGSEGNDRITKYEYDATGAVTATISGYGTSLQRNDRVNTYRADNGLLDKEADAKGNTTFYKYDNFKRLYKTVYPQPGNGAAESATDYTQTNYTAGKARVSSVRLRDGLTINFSAYDALSRVATKSGALSETFTYNNFDQVLTHTNNSTGGVLQTSTYIYNSLKWLQSETRVAGGISLGAVSYGYDDYGRRTKMTWPDAFYVNYKYDVNGYAGDYLKTITQSDGTVLATFDYYDNGQRKTLTRGNGVVTSYGYNSQRQLTGLSTDVGGAATADDIAESFGYTVAGQLKTRSQTINNTGYAFANAATQSISYTPDALNRIASSNGVTFSYDGRGNLTADDTGTSYTYNANNLLVNSTKSNVTTSLSYDAENRLYSVTKSGATTKFMYDGQDLIAETNSSNTIVRRYVHGPGDDDPIVWFEGSGTSDKRYYTYDRQGSILGVTKSDGTSLMVGAYDEYGNQSNSAIGRFQYTGQTWLPEVGLYYYKARLYSPSLGRFMQTDPIGYKDGMNWYAYVGNDPVNQTDPTGKCGFLTPLCIWLGGALLEGGAATATTAAVTTTATVTTTDIALTGAVVYSAANAAHVQQGLTSLKSEGTRELGELETIHDPDHPQNDPDIGELSDSELGEAINNPAKGDKVTVRGNKVLDGNTRINEAKGRGWADDTKIPVVELPKLPDNIDTDPLGPYGR